MKKLLAAMVSVSMLVTTVLSPVGVARADAADAAVSELITTGNEDLFNDKGEALQDDTYQYGVASDDYYAFMWVPEQARHLNGLMVAKSNLIEVRLLESVTVRKILAKYNIGVVYLHARSTTDKPSNSNIMGDFVYIDDAALAKYNSSYSKPANAGAVLDEMLARLACVSGYDELRYAPLIGVGHSAGMGLGRALGSWDPGRAIAQICMKGGTGVYIPGVTEYTDSQEVQPGVPTYLATGQYTEHGSWNNPASKDDYIDKDIPSLVKFRQKGTDRLVSMSVEWETGHYDWGEQSNEVVANYLDHVIPARLGTQATSGEKLQADYELVDLTKSEDAYLAETAMFGSRTVINKESTYKHGLASSFTEEEQKDMVWFVNQAQYEFVRDFTQERKNVETINDNVEEKNTRATLIPVSYDRSYNTSTGDFSQWPTGNICFYIDNTQAIAMEFDISALKEYTDMVDSVSLTMPFKSGNSTRAATLYQIDNPWDADRNFTIPTLETVVADGMAANNISADLTDIVKNATADKIYLALATTESGNGSDYYATTEYAGYTNGSLTTTESLLPHLSIRYTDDAEEKEVRDRHQYLRLEDPGKGVPKELSRITRYDVVNPGDTGFQNGIEGDPNTFSMVVDKMNQVTCDHYDVNGNNGKVYTEEGTPVEVSDTPAYLVPAMAPMEWVGVKQEPLNETDSGNHVASKWRNYLRWKNNRVYYHMASQDQYVNVNTYDVYNTETGELEFSRGTQTFQIYGPTNQSGTPQVITFDDIPDCTVSELQNGVIVNPTSNKAADGYQVDLMVDYGPLKAELQADGSYKLKLHQLPVGAPYPIECKVVATQFGSSLNKVRRAEPVEKVFYIYEDTAVSPITTPGVVNTNTWEMAGITGFRIEGTGTITLGMQNDTRFNADLCAKISEKRANSTDAYYAKHYQYPENYNPYDYWSDYPGTWTAKADNGFVSLGDFVNGERTNIDLTYINTIAFSEGITKVTPVTAQTEVVGAKANPWGKGVNLVWQKSHGAAYDAVAVYDGETLLGKTSSGEATNLVVAGLEKGAYTLTVKTIKDGQESTGVTVEAAVDGKNYLVDDLEGGDLTAGLNWASYAKIQSAYSFSSYMGESLLLSKDGEDNHYLAMQCTYTPYIQTVNVSVPGGLTPEMSKLVMDIKVDKLENSQSNGQVYFELYNPVTGQSYSLERGDEFSLEDKEWHMDYTISLSDFKLPTDADELAQITVLKIGRKAVGGGNNNRRAKMYLDDIVFSEVPDYTLRSFTLEKIDADETDGKADLTVNWAKPNGGADNYSITVKKNGKVMKTEILDGDSTSYTMTGLAMGADYTVTLDVMVAEEIMESKTRSIGFFVPDKEVTYTVTQDTSYKNANEIQTGCFMIGRGRIGMIQFNIEELGKVAKAELKLSQIRGTAVPMAAFLMPNNDWKEDSADYVPSKYKPIADGDKTLSSYSVFDKASMFPEAPSTDVSALPSEEEQLQVLQGAASGSLKEFYHGDCAVAGGSLNMDVTGAVSEAQRLGNTTVTLLLVTPYSMTATYDLWGKDTVWNGTAVTEEQQPKLTVAYAAEQGTPAYGDMNGDGNVTAVDALAVLQLAVSGGEIPEEQLEKADVDGQAGLTSKDALCVLQYASGELTLFPVEE